MRQSTQFGDGIERTRLAVLRQQRDQPMHADVRKTFYEIRGDLAARRHADFEFAEFVTASPARLRGA